jgi:signal transduction histidine kinase
MDLGKNNKTLELTPVDLHSLMDDLSEVFQQKLEEKNIKLLISASRYDPIYVLAERKILLSNVLGNLLQNAIKFSSIGGRIMIFLSNSPSEIKVTIKDQGIGIPQNIMEKLFDPDKRSSRPGTNGETGSGFGLPICKSCMELFGGALTIESKTAEESPDQHGTAITLIFKHAPRTGQLLQPKPASSLPQMQNAQHPEQ